MPSPTHQILVELFRRCPTLLTDLLDAAATRGAIPALALPPGARVVPTAATFTDLLPAEFRPDLALHVLPLGNDRPRRVFGPNEIPRITELGQARALPELTLLSALIHCRTPGGEHAVYAALAAACSMLDTELRVLYFSVVRALISDDVQRPLEALMHFEGNSVDRHVFRYYYNLGMKEAREEALRALLVKLLTQRFGSLSEDAMTRIQAADADLLTHWGERLLAAPSLDDVLDSAP